MKKRDFLNLTLQIKLKPILKKLNKNKTMFYYLKKNMR